tara:strand:+ start:377 stop:583 length:207 start_codon:yes stop_codon:yes gene_type:complete
MIDSLQGHVMWPDLSFFLEKRSILRSCNPILPRHDLDKVEEQALATEQESLILLFIEMKIFRGSSGIQ